jgi:hypothetical protein
MGAEGKIDGKIDGTKSETDHHLSSREIPKTQAAFSSNISSGPYSSSSPSSP